MTFSEKDSDLLKQAFERYNEKYLPTLPNNEELEYLTFSPKFENKMQRLIKRQKKFYYSMINTVGKRIACIAAIVLIAFTASLSVEAVREFFVRFVTEIHDRFTVINFQVEDEKDNFEFVRIVPEYIPEGYILESEESDGMLYSTLIYVNDNNEQIYFSQVINSETIGTVDTENTVFDTIIINGLEGIIFENKRVKQLVIGNEEYIFTIAGPISYEEIIKIAESLKI